MKKDNSVLEIDLNAISNNVKILQSYCSSSVKHLAIVKADAYGHGAVKVAKRISSQVHWFAVNNINEGIELREAGIEHPILVFMPPNEATAEQYLQHDLTATVSAREHFSLLPAGAHYHLQFDTGMGRLGFYEKEAEQVLGLMSEFKGLNCTGIYSHFANSDTVKSPTLNKQIESFKRIRSHFGANITAHLCNTGGTIQMNGAHLDMVRLGIGMYGFGPGEVNIPGICPAMQWKTSLVQVKPIKEGASVSYGSTWQCPEDGFLGVLPVGFEDGLPRRLSGGARVKIGDEYYSTAGIITMNYTMVYLRERSFNTGTEVLLLVDENTVGSWADSAGTIPYEVMTRISPKIPRKYVH